MPGFQSQLDPIYSMPKSPFVMPIRASASSRAGRALALPLFRCIATPFQSMMESWGRMALLKGCGYVQI